MMLSQNIATIDGEVLSGLVKGHMVVAGWDRK